MCSDPTRPGRRSPLQHVSGQVDFALSEQLRRDIHDAAGVSLQQIPCALMALVAQNVALGLGEPRGPARERGSAGAGCRQATARREHGSRLPPSARLPKSARDRRHADCDPVHQRKMVRGRDVGCPGEVLVENLDAGDTQTERQRDHGMSGFMVCNTEPAIGHLRSKPRYRLRAAKMAAQNTRLIIIESLSSGGRDYSAIIARVSGA